MNDITPRLRMFAGPNGSGKSELKKYLPPALLGVYLNPDELERTVRVQGFLDLSVYGMGFINDELLSFFKSSEFLATNGLSKAVDHLVIHSHKLIFDQVEINSYFASVAVDFIRQKLLQAGISFTFETVMSHPGKVAFLKKAQESGYRTYLYYIATDDPTINISRVRNRVLMGGHNVPEGLIESRYHRSLNLLIDAIHNTNRAYIFDNSGDNVEMAHTWLAEITDGKELDLKTDEMPAWFKHAVLDKIT